MPSKYDPELRQRALRMLAEACPEHESLTAACRRVGGLLDVSPETLRVWQRRYDIVNGVKPGVTTDMAEENRRLRRENAELKKANEVLKGMRSQPHGTVRDAIKDESPIVLDHSSLTLLQDMHNRYL